MFSLLALQQNKALYGINTSLILATPYSINYSMHAMHLMSHDKLLVHLLNQIKVGVTFMFRNTVMKINDDRSICSIYNEYLYNYCFSFSPVSNNLRGSVYTVRCARW